MFTIYALVDPRDGRVRYVGRTTGGIDGARLRLRSHLSERPRAGNAKSEWFSGLAECGADPIVLVLQEGAADGDDASVAEQNWIAAFRTTGAELVNSSARVACCSVTVDREQDEDVALHIPGRARDAVAMAGASAREIDTLAGISQGMTQAIRSGRRPNPCLNVFTPLCEVLGLTLEWLVAGRGDPPTAESVQAAVSAARARKAA